MQRRRDARARAAAERRRVHRVELRAAADAARPRRLAAALPGRGRALRPARVGALPLVRRPGRVAAGRPHLPRGAVPRAPRVPAALGAGAQADGAGTFAVRGDARARALVPRPRRLPLRGASAGQHAQPAARRFRRGDPRGLLPALRRRDGADAAHARHPGARRRRLHGRHVEGGVWTVTDQQAHAWVEAWFAGLRLARVRSRRRGGGRSPPSTRSRRTPPTRCGARDGPLPRLHRGTRRRPAGRPHRLRPSRTDAGASPWWLVASSSPRSRPGSAWSGRSGRGASRGSGATTRAGLRRACARSSSTRSSIVVRTFAPDATPSRAPPRRPRACSGVPAVSLTEALAEARYGPPSRAQARRPSAREQSSGCSRRRRGP